ncbi:Rrf2 family transcriptional regulator [Paracoccus sp. MKU1]|uniref:RrF2 family transcriptional regulator n=1 Tax=Paracoccus sp. MKU1 TaxID=1745182 RepID=UPI000B0C1977|nr:Rrf2 family transcriptional regulator [Paracoccus sp. MKU1]
MMESAAARMPHALPAVRADGPHLVLARAIDRLARAVLLCGRIEEAPCMRLTSFSDYALRLLIYAARHPDRLVTIEEAAAAYDISRSHLTKVANVLTRAGFLNSVRGRSGGLELGREPAALSLGEVLRVTEPDMAAAECFGPEEIRDPNRPGALDAAIRDALAAFLQVMDRRSLADLLADEQE